jgi:hypothetical protein
MTYVWAVLLAVFTGIPLAVASVNLSLSGSVYGATSDFYIIQAGKQLIYIKRDQVSKADQSKFEKIQADIMIDLPAEAIVGIKPTPAGSRSPKVR